MIRLLVGLFRALDRAGNPFVQDDADLARTWDAVDETTRQIAFFRNYHELQRCLVRRFNHAAVEGAEYRGVEP